MSNGGRRKALIRHLAPFAGPCTRISQWAEIALACPPAAWSSWSSDQWMSTIKYTDASKHTPLSPSWEHGPLYVGVGGGMHRKTPYCTPPAVFNWLACPHHTPPARDKGTLGTCAPRQAMAARPQAHEVDLDPSRMLTSIPMRT